MCLRRVLFVALLCSGSATAADNEAPAFLNAKDAGIDYAIQGEYVGEIGSEKWGAHVIATGKGSFKAIGYRGGLPGDGWNGDPGQYVSGKLQGAVALLESDTFYVEVDGKALSVFANDEDEIGAFRKVNRKSKTLGAKPPENATILFDGKDVEAWVDGKLMQGEFLGATNCYSKEKFGDHTLHVEFRTPFMPASAGQQRGNSGVYIQSRYELQVLDSFGLEGKDNECGGIYQIRKPTVNMCYPPLAWQTYDIEFVAARWDGDRKTENARVTIRHNGVVIHKDLELPKHTPGRIEEGSDPAPLFLQNHGNPVFYRNIWVVKK